MKDWIKKLKIWQLYQDQMNETELYWKGLLKDSMDDKDKYHIRMISELRDQLVEIKEHIHRR